MKEKHLIMAAKALSLAFTPFYLPVVGLVILFGFTYLSLLPWLYKGTVVALVYLLTILMPTLVIKHFRRWHGWSRSELSRRERRIMPYLISICSYFLCCYVMQLLHIPHFIGSILIAALMIQIVCSLVNVWWKVSTHTAAIGGVAGAVLAFSTKFFYNPVWWLALVILLAGMVGTSRMILRQHTLAQVVGGFLLGLAIVYWLVLYW